MYAVIESGGKQLRVAVGEVVRVERVAAEVGSSVIFERVLMFTDADDRMQIGSPTLDGVRVHGTVVRQGRGDKIVIYTYKKTQNANRRRRGHRQAFTAVKIEAIEA